MANKLIQRTRIKGSDGFVVARLVYTVDVKEFARLVDTMKQGTPPFGLHKDAYWNDSIIKSIFVRYLRHFCSDSFAVGLETLYPTEVDNYENRKAIYVAFRSEKDLFKYVMKIGAKRVRWWRSATVFTFVGKVDDPFEGRHAGSDWNYEDPQDMIE